MTETAIDTATEIVAPPRPKKRNSKADDNEHLTPHESGLHAPGKTIWLAPSQIEYDLEHNSRPMNEKHITKLMASIREFGLLQPIGVLSYAHEDGAARYRLVYGFHRLIAMVRLMAEPGTRDIMARCELIEAEHEAALSVNTVENMHRADYSPLQRANLVARLADQGHSQTSIAGMMNCSPATITLYKSLLNLIPQFQKLADTGQLKLVDANAIAKLTAEEQQKRYEKWEEAKANKDEKQAKKENKESAEGGRMKKPPSSKKITAVFAEAARVEEGTKKKPTSATLFEVLAKYTAGRLKEPAMLRMVREIVD